MPSKQELFDALRRDAVEVFGDSLPADMIPCPLCLHFTAFDDCTIEHVVPDKAGGRCKTLSCKTCNNSAGSKIDTHLVNWHRSQNAFTGGTIKCEVRVGNAKMKANFTRAAETGMHFDVVGKASNLDDVAKAKDRLTSGEENEMAITFYFDYSIRKLWLALLKAAYFAVFRQEGYQYVTHANAKRVSSNIRELEATLNLDAMIGKIKTNMLMPPWDDEVIIVSGKSIPETPCYVVIIRVCEDNTVRHMVYLPQAEEWGEELYGDLQSLDADKKQFSFEMKVQMKPADS